MNFLVESEGIDSKIFIPVIEPLVKKLCTIFLTELLLLGVRKYPLRSSICESEWSQGWVSLHFLPPCRERQAADVHALGKEYNAAKRDISLQYLDDELELRNVVLVVLR
jgi:hypothetical protein